MIVTDQLSTPPENATFSVSANPLLLTTNPNVIGLPVSEKSGMKKLRLENNSSVRPVNDAVLQLRPVLAAREK